MGGKIRIAIVTMITVTAMTGLLPEAALLQAEGAAEEESIHSLHEEAEQEQTDEAQRKEKELTGRLYAKAAVLLDMDSGRVLYEKNGKEALPMASTTKIMTCILALETTDREAVVTASAYAAGQPKVHLGMQKGMSYKMDDLLHSLMLESHNDSAVAIAEYIGGRELDLPAADARTKEESMEAVRVFCSRMTKKAEEIGCEHTHFLTPNGLDAEAADADGEKIIHSTTAEDLARIMRYCVMQSPQREAFLEITQSPFHSFGDTEGKAGYACSNHNAFLHMMDGALSGKTGFTSQAGYCYVGALERDGRRLALALLACGWPNHKTWKWADSKNLFAYGLENYTYREFSPEAVLQPIPVADGAAKDGSPFHGVSVAVRRERKELPIRLLVKQGEDVVAETEIKETLHAPVEKGMQVGSVTYYLVGGDGGREYLTQEAVYTAGAVPKRDFLFVLRFICGQFLIR